MLVLTRKLGEKLVIDGNIVVRVIDVQGDKVRLGIEAPKEVPIHREEVFRRLDEGDYKTGLRPIARKVGVFQTIAAACAEAS